MTKINWKKNKTGDQDKRLEFFRYVVVLFASIIILKLGYIQVFQHVFYEALASGQHEFFQKLIPKRGMIYLHDLKDESLVPLAVNQQLASVYADPRQIKDPRHTSEALGGLLGYTPEQIEALEKRLDQPEDPYEPIAKEIDDHLLEKINALNLEGIHSFQESVRF